MVVNDFASPIGVRDTIVPRTLSKSGVGDIFVRAKYSSWQGLTRSFGFMGEVRLPTGDEENLLGLDRAAGRGALLMETSVGAATLHGNVGYGVGGNSDVFDFVAAADIVVGNAKRLTVAASLGGQTFFDGVQFETLRTYDAVGDKARVTYDRRIAEDSSLTILTGAVGAKYHLTGPWLLNASVLIPIGDSGFRGGVTPVIGLDRTWARRR
jgi:hypothetical protein